MKNKNNGKHKQFLHVIMIQSSFKYLFVTSVKCSDYKLSPFFFLKLAKTYPFHGLGFHTPVASKIGYKVKKIRKYLYKLKLWIQHFTYIYISLSYTMVRAHVRCDNARAWVSALLHVHAQNHGITDLSHFHACRSSTSQDISCWMLGI